MTSCWVSTFLAPNLLQTNRPIGENNEIETPKSSLSMKSIINRVIKNWYPASKTVKQKHPTEEPAQLNWGGGVEIQQLNYIYRESTLGTPTSSEKPTSGLWLQHLQGRVWVRRWLDRLRQQKLQQRSSRRRAKQREKSQCFSLPFSWFC